MINYDYLRVELQKAMEDAGMELVLSAVKTEKLISELQREDRLKAQMKKDFKFADAHAEVFSKIFGRLNY